jgi:hypothetical protein
MFGIAILAFCLTAPFSFAAEQAMVDLGAPDAIRHALEQQVGKRVKVKLVSGQDLDGKVLAVNAQAVILAELGGMDFFDATVRLDQVAAVLIKVRGK